MKQNIFRKFALFAYCNLQIYFSPLSINYLNNGNAIESIDCGSYNVRLLSQVGAGGGGTVYQADFLNHRSGENTVGVFKKSNLRSSSSLQNECSVLRYLEAHSVKGVEKCVDLCTNKESDYEQVSLLLYPYFHPKVSSYGSLSALLDTDRTNGMTDAERSDNHYTTILATKHFIDICLNILSVGIANSDIQYLVDPSTGDVLLIDFTEAVKLSSLIEHKNTLNEYEKALVINFISEIRSFIPNEIQDVAETYLNEQMRIKFVNIPSYSFLFD